MKDLSRRAVSRLAMTGLVLVVIGLLPLCSLIGDCTRLQAASAATGLIVIAFVLGRSDCPTAPPRRR
jgi:hypothetical protein